MDGGNAARIFAPAKSAFPPSVAIVLQEQKSAPADKYSTSDKNRGAYNVSVVSDGELQATAEHSGAYRYFCLTHLIVDSSN
jgi:hypothetical protein